MDTAGGTSYTTVISDLLVGSSYVPGGNAANYVMIDHTTGNVFVDLTGSGNFSGSAALNIATLQGFNGIAGVSTINIILNHLEGIKQVIVT